ncbi:MAG: 3-oxoacyl-ACP synthase [Thermoleophilia bacterium]|jgi:3-oxoacyl-(acyl-carrier-protein) synthase III|nr:3-oxoacyl-ACP synthase [Thermoleophilia bacterium]
MTSFDTWPPISIAGTGSYVPERVVANAELVESGLDTTAAWIVERTGIIERRWAADDQQTSDLAIEAARRAMLAAEVHPDEIDLVVLATSTPNWPQPSTASAVHHGLGLRPDAGAIDVNAVCSGFVYALHAGASMLAGGETWTNALVIGAEVCSRVTDPADRTTRIFFGDGAGAVVLRKELEVADVVAMAAADAGLDPGSAFAEGLDGGTLDEDTAGLRSVAYTVDHSGRDALIVREPGGYFEMDGPAAKAFAVPALVDGVRAACRDALLDVDELTLLVPHQSNLRMLEEAIDTLGLPEGRLATTIRDFGNTAAASIPITLDVAVRAGRVRPGDLICLAGYGGGLQTATCVLRWAD